MPLFVCVVNHGKNSRSRNMLLTGILAKKIKPIDGNVGYCTAHIKAKNEGRFKGNCLQLTGVRHYITYRSLSSLMG